MNAILVLALNVVAQNCGQGEMKDSCCECFTGWAKKDASSETCDVCAPGYVHQESSDNSGLGICSNGRDGSPCTAALEYPFFGCSINGEKFSECSTGGVFPCAACTDADSCASAISSAVGSSSCYPSGPRMYTTFPNQAIVGKEYSLTILGCDMKKTDTYAVIPAFTDDLTEERPCSTLGNTSTGGIPSSCTFSGSKAVIGSSGNCTGLDGFLLSSFTVYDDVADMAEVTFTDIIMDEGAFGGTASQRASANAAESGKEYQILEKETYFRVCKLAQVAGRTGTTYEWLEVASHDHIVSERDYMYKISKEELYDPSAAAAASDDGDSCCDGLKLGPLCLPLWVFLLLWILMACCLGGMGYALNKNKNEIEAQKNNLKYEKFNVDAEMSAMAAKQAEDDDDI